jgi:hypothetical protein
MLPAMAKTVAGATRARLKSVPVGGGTRAILTQAPLRPVPARGAIADPTRVLLVPILAMATTRPATTTMVRSETMPAPAMTVPVAGTMVRLETVLALAMMPVITSPRVPQSAPIPAPTRVPVTTSKAQQRSGTMPALG